MGTQTIRGSQLRSTSVPYSVLNSSIFNIKDPRFGAVGDGSADDTNAIKLAFDFLPAYGGIIYAPAGIYKFTSSLTFPNKCFTLKGDGEFTRFYYVPDDGTDAFYLPLIASLPGLGFGAGKIIFKDFLLYGAGRTSNTGDGIHLWNTTQVKFYNVDVYLFGGGSGIHFEGGHSCNVHGGSFRQNNYGIRLGVAETTSSQGYKLAATGVNIYEADIQSNNEAGLYTDNISVISNGIYGGIIQGNYKDGIYLNNCNTFVMDNVYFESNNTTTTSGCADIRTNGSISQLTMRNINTSATPISLNMTGVSVTNLNMQTCSFGGGVILTDACLDVYMPNVGIVGTFTNNAANTVRDIFRHIRKSFSWTPGAVTDGDKVSANFDMIEDVSSPTQCIARLNSGWTPGTIIQAVGGYINSHTVTVTLSNETGADHTYNATTVYIDAIQKSIPYA